jgi:hypothetical protein
VDEQAVMDTLQTLRKAGKLAEVYRVHRYKAYRDDALGLGREIEIEVLDRGPEFSHSRYGLKARDEDGRVATGNSAATLEEAILLLHWEDLTKDAPSIE